MWYLDRKFVLRFRRWRVFQRGYFLWTGRGSRISAPPRTNFLHGKWPWTLQMVRIPDAILHLNLIDPLFCRDYKFRVMAFLIWNERRRRTQRFRTQIFTEPHCVVCDAKDKNVVCLLAALVCYGFIILYIIHRILCRCWAFVRLPDYFHSCATHSWEFRVPKVLEVSSWPFKARPLCSFVQLKSFAFM